MSLMIQPLESRTFLSATPLAALSVGAAETKLLGDLKTVRADLQHARPALSADLKSLTAELKKLPPSAQNKSLLATLRADENKTVNTIRQDLSAVLRAGAGDARAILGDAIRLFLSPSNSADQKKLAADLGKLQKDTSAPLATLSSDLNTYEAKLSSDLTAIAKANPTDAALQTAVSAANTDASSTLSKLQTDRQTIQSDVTSLINALNA